MFRIAFLILATVLIVLGIVFFYVDKDVERALARRSNPSTSAAYSDSLVVAGKFPYSAQALQQELVERRYLEVSSPSKEGEYSLNRGVFEIVTRSFQTGEGTPIPAAQIRFVSGSGELTRMDGAAAERFILEPRLISVLASGEIRASEFVALANFPKELIAAIVAIEDERFIHHHGVDFQGIARAIIVNLQAMRVVQGGSTITQQLAKNILLSPERTIGRKLTEVFAAVSLENRLSKEEILQLYLNEIYLGQEGSVAIHGFAEAAKVYFGKKVEDLSLAESALLAGLIRAPSYLSPKRHPERALERRNVVLKKMLELGVIKESEARNSESEKIKVIESDLHRRAAPHFMAALSEELGNYLRLESASGIAVYTGLHLGLQGCAETALEAGIMDLEKRYPKLVRTEKPLEGAIVAIEPHSGKIRAWVGGRDYGRNQFDHVSQAERQIGSTIKPFLYLTALDSSLNSYRVATAISVLVDEPTKLRLPSKQVWEPENYDHEFRGEVTLRYALEHSLNLPAVYVSERVGLHSFAKLLKEAGVAKEAPEVPSLALGALDTTLLRLTAAYGALANGGRYVAPRLFLGARDSENTVVARAKFVEEPIADERAVFVLTNILQGVLERGTGKTVRALGYKATAAGKTGTSNDSRDAWFVGYNPGLVAGVWIGFDDNKPIALTGGVAAAPIWTEFMKCSQPFVPASDFVIPEGVIFRDIDGKSGELFSSGCPAENAVREVFVSGTEPRLLCHLHSGEEVREEISPIIPDSNPKRRKEGGFWDFIFG